MSKSTRRVQARLRQAGVSQLVAIGGPRSWRLAHAVPRAPELSQRAKARLDMLEWHAAHGANVSRTARHFGFSRPTVYRWLRRHDRFRLASLEDRSSVPRRRRRPSWTVAQAEVVLALRECYPRWGKAKLAVLLRREGITLSVSMVGRILAGLRRRGVLREPVGRRISARRRTWRRPHATRKPAGYPIARPGDLVQLDTLDVRSPGQAFPFKQFTARDVVSRWDTLELGRSASARAAVGVLDALARRMPFPVRALSVDGGSEFMAEFETACQARAIRLFVLPPRSQTQRRRRARQPDPHRGVLRGHRRGARARPPARRPGRLGGVLQHRPTTPGAGLPHPRRMARPAWHLARCNGRTGPVQTIDKAV